MKSVDDGQLSTWLNCLGATTLEPVITPPERDQLSSLLDLPPLFGGVGLKSLARATDKEMPDSWASITVELIKFFK